MQCVFGTLDAMWITVKLLAMLEGRHSAVQATVLLAAANKTLFRVICHIRRKNGVDSSDTTVCAGKHDPISPSGDQ